LGMAAARLGLKCQVFSPDPDSPAFDVVLNATCAEYADVEALELFANDVDVITYEFENVPAATAMVLAARRPVLPAQTILETTQDRLVEKDFVKRLGIGTADYADVSSAETLRTSIARIGLPAVIKTRRLRYDGKGGPHVLVNEIAPRVHNSGHWTLDGASISQFEQHIRAIAGWQLGKPVRHGPVTMTNLIGDDILSYEQWLTVPGATVHLYGKGPPKPGRKMGHVTDVAPASKK